MFLNMLRNGVINIGFEGMVANPEIYTKTNRTVTNMAKKGTLIKHPILTFTKKYFSNVSSWLTFLFLISMFFSLSLVWLVKSLYCIIHFK